MAAFPCQRCAVSLLAVRRVFRSQYAFCGVRAPVSRRSWRVFAGRVGERSEPIGDATEVVKEPVALAAKRRDVVLEPLHLATCVVSNSAHAALRISQAAFGLGVGAPHGFVCARMRCDQNCRHLLPDPGEFGDNLGFERRGRLQVREFAVELKDLLYELSESLIDDRAVVPLAGKGKTRRGFPRTRPICSAEAMTWICSNRTRQPPLRGDGGQRVYRGWECLSSSSNTSAGRSAPRWLGAWIQSRRLSWIP
jgi:hypothetical protein